MKQNMPEKIALNIKSDIIVFMDKTLIEEYLKVLACPNCKKEVKWKRIKDKEGFLCEKCQLFYPIVEDIPVMLVEEAIKLQNLEDEPS